MKPQQLVQFVNVARQTGPKSAMDEYGIEAWEMVVGDFALADCLEALKTLVRRRIQEDRARWINPNDIASEVVKIRERRSHGWESSFVPLAEIDGETDRDYAIRTIEAQRKHIRHLADGGKPTELAQIERKFNPEMLRGIFRDAPRIAPSTNIPSNKAETSPRMKALMRATLEKESQ